MRMSHAAMSDSRTVRLWNSADERLHDDTLRARAIASATAMASFCAATSCTRTTLRAGEDGGGAGGRGAELALVDARGR